MTLKQEGAFHKVVRSGSGYGFSPGGCLARVADAWALVADEAMTRMGGHAAADWAEEV
jgi:hypothetical protein